jgi:hypothetical protein
MEHLGGSTAPLVPKETIEISIMKECHGRRSMLGIHVA